MGRSARSDAAIPSSSRRDAPATQTIPIQIAPKMDAVPRSGCRKIKRAGGAATSREPHTARPGSGRGCPARYLASSAMVASFMNSAGCTLSPKTESQRVAPRRTVPATRTSASADRIRP